MESSKLKIEKKNKLYFNKFLYKASVKLEGVAYTYYTPDLNTFIHRIESWKNTENKESWRKVFGHSGLHRINYDLIEIYLNFRNNMIKDKIMSRITGSVVTFYSNEPLLFEGLERIDPHFQISKVELSGDSNTLYFKKDPKYKYRTYFKGRRMPLNFPENVTSFIEIYKSVKVCNGLQRFIASRTNWNPFVYVHGSYFIDYNDESMLTILHMYFGEMIGKTYTLAKEPYIHHTLF